jgi:enoyl-CoA hydratase
MSTTSASEKDLVLYEKQERIALVTMNRPRYRNAQNAAMTYALDQAFLRAINDDEVKVVVLGGAGEHFCAGHDIGTPERDIHRAFPRVATNLWPHEDKLGAENILVREQELYLGMCRRWREIPKPTVATVQGACIAGGLMLAWVCDLIIAADDAFFADPVVRMGIPGVEYFAHPYVMGPRQAREFLYLGERVDAKRALQLGMVNRVVARKDLARETLDVAARMAKMPRMGLYLAKKAINQAEDRMGLRDSMDAAFALHQLAHAHNTLSAPEQADSHLAGQGIKSMAEALRKTSDPAE